MKILPFILMLLILASCSEKKVTPDQIQQNLGIIHLEPAQIKNAGIQSAPIQYTSITESLNANGVLEVPPQNLVSISAPLGGYVRETDLLQGMKIRKGDVLAVLEHPDYIQLQQDYLNNEEKIRLATLESHRQDLLQSGQAGVEKIRQQAESNMNQLRIMQKSLSEKLKLIGLNPALVKPENISSQISIRSPVQGFVKSVHANIGRYMAPADVLFEIIDTDHLHVELRIFEKDISRVKIGQKITFSLPSQDAIQRSAHVHLVGKALNDDHTVQIHGHLDKEDPDLIPGVFVNAQIETGLDSALAVEESALVWMNGKLVIFADEGQGNYRWIGVTPGTASNGLVPVSLPAAERIKSLLIVNKGAHALLGAISKNMEAK